MKRTILTALTIVTLLSPAISAAQDVRETGEAQGALNVAHIVYLPMLNKGNAASGLDRSGAQWSTLEWTLTNATYSGNPFDLVASATFSHAESGETRSTELFYAGEDKWSFRFTPTRPGRWEFRTTSADSDLAGHKGVVSVAAAEGNGFIETSGDKWVHGGSGRAFVPQFVMAPTVDRLDDETIDTLIERFIVEHGFSGFHLTMQCRWFGPTTESCSGVSTPDPDPETFKRLERLIKRTYAAGGVVHIWMWGDSSRKQNPVRWGLNGKEDRRLQRYIAARLGPLPGWSMGYGYDLWEWVSGSQLDSWQDYMHDHLGWDHPLGARGAKNELTQLTESLDYASYEQHKPTYDTYVDTITARPNKPAFSEDRFRVYDTNKDKDYTFEETRRGLWHSAMAGGVANIWGNLSGGRGSADGSAPYPNAAQIKTYSRFFAERFDGRLERCSSRSDGACLGLSDGSRFLFYREDAASIKLDLRGAKGSLRAVAVDTKKPYVEIDLGRLEAAVQTWKAPYSSDWAIAVGE